MKRVILILTIALMSFTLSYGQELSVMTYNIRLDIASDGENAWTHRKYFLVNQIKFYSPDIMGTQEGRPNQIKYMKESLSDYNFIGQGRDGQDKGEYSAIFYNTNKLKVENENTFWLSETPKKVSKGWDAAYPRICSYGLFTHIESEEKFWIFNTHLDHIGREARLNGMNLIQKKISKVNTANYPVIVMGDFNVEPDSKLVKNLTELMLDTKSIARLIFGPEGTFNGFKFNEPVIRRIDYIMLNKSSKIDVKKYAVLSDSKNLKYPSDHLPVYVQFKLKNQSKE